MDISEQLFERAKKVLPGGVNSPVRAYRAVGMAPRFITKADGPFIWDEDGKQYIDYVCSWGPMILGHNHPVIREAVEKAGVLNMVGFVYRFAPHAAALRELEATRKAQEAEDDHTLPELEEDGESGLTFPEDYAHMTDEEVVRLCEEPNDFRQSYELDMGIMDKLKAICTKVYHADGVQLVGNAVKQIKQLEDLGFGDLPICMAKTQYSFSDDPALLGAPRGFTVTVRNLKVSAGAGFLVALTGDIMTMPGLPKVPAAEKIDVDENGVISGLF